jgi:hypothetical protein
LNYRGSTYIPFISTWSGINPLPVTQAFYSQNSVSIAKELLPPSEIETPPLAVDGH